MLITEFKQNYWKYFYKEKACIAPFVSATKPIFIIKIMLLYLNGYFGPPFGPTIGWKITLSQTPL